MNITLQSFLLSNSVYLKRFKDIKLTPLQRKASGTYSDIIM